MTNESYDLIIFGATSFVGKIVAEYLTTNYGINGDVRWAAAGRSEVKLQELRTALGAQARDLSLLCADAQDEQALHSLCEKTKVILSTVGPYALYGESLVKVCAQSGTDYCDLTGEPQWIKQMIDRYESTAQQSGARIVHCCGFDSIPSDMGVYFLQQQSLERYKQPCNNVKMRVVGALGGFSGGTLGSLLNVAEEAANNPALQQELKDIYSLTPLTNEQRPQQHSIGKATYDDDIDKWVGPFMMAPINERVVHRSNALSDYSYSKNFRYNEAMAITSGPIGYLGAAMLSGMSSLVELATSVTPLRKLIHRLFITPGSGPSEKAQEKGFFDIVITGTTITGEMMQVTVGGDRDPGYGSTSRMLVQAGISLAHDISLSEKPGGFWTPATVFDQRFIQRLGDNAGLSFAIVDI